MSDLATQCCLNFECSSISWLRLLRYSVGARLTLGGGPKVYWPLLKKRVRPLPSALVHHQIKRVELESIPITYHSVLEHNKALVLKAKNASYACSLYESAQCQTVDRPSFQDSSAIAGRKGFMDAFYRICNIRAMYHQGHQPELRVLSTKNIDEMGEVARFLVAECSGKDKVQLALSLPLFGSRSKTFAMDVGWQITLRRYTSKNPRKQ